MRDFLNALTELTAADVKARWRDFARLVVGSMRAGEELLALYQAGNVRAARAETAIAIGHAESVLFLARRLKASDTRWAPVCDPMRRAAKLHRDGLRRLPWPTGQKTFTEIGRRWSIAVLEARSLYDELGGNPNDIRSFIEEMEAADAALV